MVFSCIREPACCRSEVLAAYWRHANQAGFRDNPGPVPGHADTRGARIPDYPRTGENLASQSRYLLPKDLAGALERLDDTEVDTLLAAVTSEAKRRGRLPRGSASKTSASIQSER